MCVRVCDTLFLIGTNKRSKPSGLMDGLTDGPMPSNRPKREIYLF